MPKPRSCRVWLFAAAVLLAFANIARAQIVAFGASNVSGWNVAAAEAMPAQLQTLLRGQGYAVYVRNAGVYGNTTADMLKRMDTDIPPGTKIVVLDVSGNVFNDSHNGIGRAQSDANIATMTAHLRARGIAVVPIDFSTISPAYRQADGFHLTPAGHKLVASQLLPQVTAILGPPTAADTAMAAVREFCRADVRRLCADVPRDEASRRACLRDHRSELSKDCISAIAQARRQGGLSPP